MNHRQWKKQFKKQHGRNPEIMEDRKRWKRVMNDKAFCDFTIDFIKGFQEIDWEDFGRRLSKAFEEAAIALNRYVTEVADAMRRVIDEACG